MATIKQLKIGTTNYDIKALNATNNNTADFVVRDIKYGTAAPSGGSSGQIYLQYNSSTTSNPYIYAEDEVGSSSTNVADKYYSKSEVDELLNWKLMGTISASTTYTYPITNFRELLVVAHWTESSTASWRMTSYIPKAALTSTATYFGATTRLAPTYGQDFGCVFLATLTTIRMYQFNANRADKTSAVTTYVYYR